MPNRRRVTSLTETKQLMLEKLAEATQLIQIYAPQLDPRLLNNQQAEQILTRFVRRSRQSRVEILIENERQVAQIDHRFIRLAQNYTSYIQIKLIPKDFHDEPYAFILIDQSQMIWRSRADRFESEWIKLPAFEVKEKSRFFNEVWQQASPASALRALHL